MNETRCKMRCDCVEANGDVMPVVLRPVTQGSKENESFFKYTPAGELRLDIVNPEAAAIFEEGKQYYVDIAPAERGAYDDLCVEPVERQEEKKPSVFKFELGQKVQNITTGDQGIVAARAEYLCDTPKYFIDHGVEGDTWTEEGNIKAVED